MTYPGNSTLTQEMQDRILSTFKQTLTAAAAGNRQEATLGCDFILRLDSLFGPARELLERLETGAGPVETADLAQAAGLPVETPAAPAAPAAPPVETPATDEAGGQPPDIDDLSDLDLEMGLSDPPAPPADAPAAAEPAQPMVPPAAPEPPPATPQAGPATAVPEPPAQAPAEPAAAEPPEVDELDDLDLGLDDALSEPEPPAAAPVTPEPATFETPAPETPAPETPAAEPPPIEPPAPETPPLETPASEPPPLETPAPAPAAEPIAAPPPAPDSATEAAEPFEVPEVPDLPEVPAAPPAAEPAAPETPAVEAAATVPEVPEVAEAPEVPETPEALDLPEVPEVPEVPELPEVPDLPEAPAAAEVPDLPEQPAEAAAGEPADQPAGEPEAVEAAGLEELDDLDLSVDAGGEATPAEAGATPEEATATPPAAEPETAEAGEEEPPAEEPAAAEAAAPPASMEIPLDSEPAAQLDSESQQRIGDLLAEGQEAFDKGEYQGAIDAWSRIFLIDIDHAEANERIEEARKLKAEGDRRVEEKFHEGLAQLEGGETDAAADTFRAVLEMQSSHLQAREYLEKLEAGEVPVPTEVSRPAEVEPDGGEIAPPGLEEGGEADESPKVKPDRGTKAVGERVVTVKKSPFKSKGFLAIAAAGLVAVLGGAWYLFDNWSTLFPNSAQEAPAAAAPNPLERARGLHDEGKTPIAIAQLRRLPPDSPQYDEAQALIAQWELEMAPAATGPEGPSPQEMARREALVTAAGTAAENREFMRTSELLSEAATVAPLRGAEVQLLARADEQLQDLQEYITYFREGEWDLGLRELWLKHEADPGNRDVTRLLVDSYYNLGLRALQRKDLDAASEQFGEALDLSPDDPELLRLADFAATYQTRQNDLLYRIFVKYHPFR